MKARSCCRFAGNPKGGEGCGESGGRRALDALDLRARQFLGHGRHEAGAKGRRS